MAHQAQIISVEELADSALAIRARCCDNPDTDSVHTIYGLHTLTTQDIQRLANDHLANVEMKHLAKNRAKEAIQVLLPPTP